MVKIKKFKSDGCSFYPDQNIKKCCLAHDKVYWKGGTKKQRKIADKNFIKCVEKKGHKIQGKFMYAGIRVGGNPYIPTKARWGYGYDYPRGYK